jgi:hypothetical protein
MYKFKVGDKVRFKDGRAWATTGLVEFTIKTIGGGMFTIEEHPFSSRPHLIELVLPERQALSDAMDLCVKYEVKRFCSSQGIQWAVGETSGITLSRSGVLDKLFPTKTPEQLEIEEVEGKLRVLADQLAILKER